MMLPEMMYEKEREQLDPFKTDLLCRTKWQEQTAW